MSRQPDRDEGSKWFISKEVWEPDLFPSWCQGLVYFLPPRYAGHLFNISLNTRYMFTDDVYIAVLVDKAKEISIRSLNYFSEFAMDNHNLVVELRRYWEPGGRVKFLHVPDFEIYYKWSVEDLNTELVEAVPSNNMYPRLHPHRQMAFRAHRRAPFRLPNKIRRVESVRKEPINILKQRERKEMHNKIEKIKEIRSRMRNHPLSKDNKNLAIPESRIVQKPLHPRLAEHLRQRNLQFQAEKFKPDLNKIKREKASPILIRRYQRGIREGIMAKIYRKNKEVIEDYSLNRPPKIPDEPWFQT